MLKKFNHINCATYKNFNWELDEFGKINIIYGHNGAGKTTLSRIIRSFETKELPQGYDDIKFEIQTDIGDFTNTNIKNADFEVRVYNRDFVNKNLNFLINGENSGSILSFQSAILGEHNDIIFREIKELENKIGKKPDPENAIIASGFVGDIIYITQQIEDKIREKSKKENDLNSKLSKIAQDIKYSSLLAEPNYNITKVKEEIKNITLENLDSKILNDEQIQINENRLRDESKEAIKLNFNFQQAQMSEILSQAKILVEEKLTPREEIQDELRKWLEAGLQFHSHTDEEQECKFCKSKVSKERITELLENLNDEKRQRNKSKIEKLTNLIKVINNNYDEKYLKNIHAVRKEALYLEYQKEGEKIKNDAEEIFNKYNNLLKTILKKLEDKYENPYKDIIFGNFTDNSNEVAKIIDDLENLANKNNEKTDRLSKDKEDAKKAIIISKISKGLKDIDYFSKQQEIEALDNELNGLYNYKNDKIKEKEEAEEKKRKLHDEISSEQASINNINRYLNSFFGNETLQFRVLKDKVGEFEILRNGQKADNLSEGECTLIGFCYFMAKLQDLKTDGEKPYIIWIDDPISSLDSNHIFFIFSLINSELFEDKKLKYKQLFISTHNLDFLKYLKRLADKTEKSFYMIQKDENGSKIVDMPKFLKDYTTEFSYLFEQIYKYKNINERYNEDTKTILTYNFGNNLRKFLEIYLFFKYPQKKSLGVETIERFFGSTQNAILLNRYIQEYSHSREIIERGMKPLDIPESKKIAEFVLETIQKKDPEQYEALCESIDENKEKDMEISKKGFLDE